MDGPTGAQGIETDTGLIYNPSSGTLTSTKFSGNLTGTATTATNVTASANNTNNETTYLTFVDGPTGAQGIETDTGLIYNPSSGTLTSTKFSGNLTGNVTGTATTATNVTASANNTNNETTYLTFVDGPTGAQGIETDTGLIYNPSSGTLTSTKFSGNLTGTATTATTATNVTASANNTN